MTKILCFIMTALMSIVSLGQTAQAAPVRAQITGEIERITLDTPGDHWSGGTIQVNGGVVILPRNLLIDLPANRLTLQQIFAQAPAACVAVGQSGLAKADTCTNGVGGIVTLSANETNGGNTIAGDVFIEKGIEAVNGPVTYINYTDGYMRVNGNAPNPTQVDDNTGVMVRINDPTGRHTVQQGLGCVAGSPNCSPDPRFTLDPDNYTNVFTSGFPLCLPSTVSRTFTDRLGLGTTTAQSTTSGTGDVLCPTTNRTINAGNPVDDSRRFAPIMLGDSITAEGNMESIDCVRFLSSHTLIVSRALSTKIGVATQPDYMFLDEVGVDVAGFQNLRARTLIIGFTTEADTDVMVWSLHRDPATNVAHEFPLATVVGCDSAGGAGTCGGLGLAGVSNIFKIRHDVDFLVGAKPKLDPCAHLLGDPRMGTGFCGGTVNETNIKDMFGILSPAPHEIQARTGKKYRDLLLATPQLITLDIHGNEATNGQYLFPLGLNLGGLIGPEFVEINLDALDTPFSFTGIPWNLDRRLGPGGCDGPCEGTVQPLDPFPFEGLAMDPRTQASSRPVGAYNDPHFTSSPLTNVMDRILSFVTPNGTNFNGNNTLLAWPGVTDPAHIPVLPAVPVTPPPNLVNITSLPIFVGTQGLPYTYQVFATNVSDCAALTYSLDVFPAGMTIDPAGLVQWTPTLAQVGSNTVTVRVTAGDGSFDTQSFGVVVAGVPATSIKNDFNLDGKVDLLWRNTATGQNLVWFMTGSFGTTFSNYVLLTPVTDQNWKMVGTADFNGDTKVDILWRNTSTGQNIVWFMNGTAFSNYVFLPTVVDQNWKMAGTADFNGDGKFDILWRNTSTGQNIVWFMTGANGTTFSNYVFLPPVADQNWKMTGTADFNGDGKVDILWRNTSTGQNIVWFMTGANGTSLIRYAFLTTVADQNWKMAGTADFNADGKPDILWRNTSTGENMVWFMTGADGTTMIGNINLLTVADQTWQIAAPK
jgi:hypothetical protein